MHSPTKIETYDKPAFYVELATQMRSLLDGERDFIANAANFAALIFELVPDLNWTGFYFLKEHGELVLGPFQGRVACVRIPSGKGVCGTAVAEGRTLRVPDVHAFPGHIACDSASRSELVIPLLQDGCMVGVLDLDSPIPERFDADDQAGFEALAELYVAASDLPTAIHLFSYGTLQQERVQLSTFGRLLHGSRDAIVGFRQDQVEITDPAVLEASGKRFHPILVRTNQAADTVPGVVFRITAEELRAADTYEVSDYVRIETVLASGKKAWVYVANSGD